MRQGTKQFTRIQIGLEVQISTQHRLTLKIAKHIKGQTNEQHGNIHNIYWSWHWFAFCLLCLSLCCLFALNSKMKNMVSFNLRIKAKTIVNINSKAENDCLGKLYFLNHI